MNILRLPAVEARTGYKRPSIYRLEKEGKFPRRVKLGLGQGGAVGWVENDISSWIEARQDGRPWTPADSGATR